MSDLDLMIVTIIAGVPRVLANPIASCGPVDEWREQARSIARANPTATVWLLDADGEYPWYRFDNGIETYLCDETGMPLAQVMDEEGVTP